MSSISVVQALAERQSVAVPQELFWSEVMFSINTDLIRSKVFFFLYKLNNITSVRKTKT